LKKFSPLRTLNATACRALTETKKAMVVPISAKFVRTASYVDEEFTRQTVGLVAADQFSLKKRQLVDDLALAASTARSQRQQE
jgi:hypothetical protein